MGKKPNISVTYENERISIKNSFPYIKCVLHLLCGPWADLWPSAVLTTLQNSRTHGQVGDSAYESGRDARRLS